MTYNPNIPQGTDNISVSQAQILGNFGQLNTQFAIDHTAFNTGSGNGDGFHKKVTLPGNVTPPTPAANFCSIYGKTTSSVTIPWLRRDGLAGSPEWSMVPIKAFGSFVGTTGVVVGTAMNVTCVRNSTGLYTLTLPANVVSSANYSVLASVGNTINTLLCPEYEIINATSFRLRIFAPQSSGVTTGVLADSAFFSVAVLQF